MIVASNNTLTIRVPSDPEEYTVNGIDVSKGAGGSTFYKGDNATLEVDFNDDSALNITIKTTPFYGGAIMINDSTNSNPGYALSVDIISITDASSINTYSCKTFISSNESNIIDRVGMHWISSDTSFPVDTSSTYRLSNITVLSTANVDEIAKSKSGHALTTAYINSHFLSTDSNNVRMHMPLLTEVAIEPSDPKFNMVITTMYNGMLNIDNFPSIDLNPTANVTEDYSNNMATIAVRNNATAYIYISSDNDLEGFQAQAVGASANYIEVNPFDIHKDEEDYPLAVLLATSYGGKLHTMNTTDTALGIVIKYTGSDASFNPTNVYVISSADPLYSRSLNFSINDDGSIRIDGNSDFIEDLNHYWYIYKCALSYELHIEGEFTYNTKQINVTSESTDVNSVNIQGESFSLPLNEEIVK